MFTLSAGRKSVHFADSIGHSLVAVKTITPNSSSEDLRTDIKKQNHAHNKAKNGFNTSYQVILPSHRSISGFVKLENLRCSSTIISGYVRVVNLSYEKIVTIRYTQDEWKTYKDTQADFGFSLADECTDVFVFTIFLLKKKELSAVELAVCYQAAGEEFWDNNFEKNYRIELKTTT